MSHTGKIDIAELKRAADGRWVEILTQFGVAPDILDGRHHPCPKCGGVDRFRCVEPAVGACYCNQCFKSRNGDGIAAIAWFNEWTFSKTVEALGDHLGMNGRTRQSVAPADIVKAIALCKRVPLESFKSFGAHTDQRGKLLVCRVPMFDEHRAECGYQDFSKISPEFLKGMCADGQPVGLFVAQWPTPGDEVLITEGVKDSAALHSLGYRAVGIPGSQLQVKHARVFAGCHVKVVPDLDATGMKAAHVTAARLMGVAASVQIVRMPGEIKATDGDGVREVLARADGEILLRQSIADAVEWHAAKNETSTKPDDSEWTSINSDQGRTDRANARRFCEAHCDTARFCHAWEKWMIWAGTRWHIDKSGAAVRLAMDVADAVWIAAKEHRTKEVVQFASKTSGRGALNAMLELASADLPVAVDELDSDPWLLNCPNTTVDLRTSSGNLHRREDYITQQCPTRFVPDAPCPVWEAFLYSIFQQDIDLIHFIQRYLGYCLAGVISEQILVVCYGTGSNGKSTMLNVLQLVLGNGYCNAAPQGLLMEKKTDSHPTELADLFGKRLVIAQETNQGSRLAESTVKQLTGGDTISARRMREDFWTFKPTHKLVLATNHKPRIKGTDHAIWRRLVLIPFEQRFWNPAKGESGPEHLRQDKDLLMKLAAEAEGILAWMVRGCLDWQQSGLQIPDSVRTATAAYRSEEDTVGRFVSECCITEELGRVKFSDLYARLEQWGNESGDNIPSRKFVSQWLKENGYRDKQSGVRWYIGIRLSSET